MSIKNNWLLLTSWPLLEPAIPPLSKWNVKWNATWPLYLVKAVPAILVAVIKKILWDEVGTHWIQAILGIKLENASISTSLSLLLTYPQPPAVPMTQSCCHHAYNIMHYQPRPSFVLSSFLPAFFCVPGRGSFFCASQGLPLNAGQSLFSCQSSHGLFSWRAEYLFQSLQCYPINCCSVAFWVGLS